MRLFVALELPEEVKRHLVALQGGVVGIRWLPPEQLHLTLLFLGEVEEDKLGQIISALAEIKMVPFTLQIAQTGCFPHAHAPRVLWVGLARQPLLARLHQQVATAVKTCGIELEKRSFSPHITLARVKQLGSADISSFLFQPLSDQIPPVSVGQFVLFQSILSPHGAMHRQIRVFSG